MVRKYMWECEWNIKSIDMIRGGYCKWLKIFGTRSGIMNRIYKLVWNRVRNCYVVTSELAKSYGRNNGNKL